MPKAKNRHDRTSDHDKLRDEIVDYLNSLSNSDFEVSPPGSRTGKHDITGCYHGRYVSIDIKTGDAKPTKLQLYEARRKNKAGAFVLFAHNLKEVQIMIGDMDRFIIGRENV